MSKPIPVHLSPERVAEIRGRKGRLERADGAFIGTVEVAPMGEGRYSVVLVDLTQWVERRGYPEVRLSAEMLERVKWLKDEA